MANDEAGGGGNLMTPSRCGTPATEFQRQGVPRLRVTVYPGCVLITVTSDRMWSLSMTEEVGR